MAAFRSALLALLVVPVGMAGCILEDDGPPLTISVPAMGPAEAWTLAGPSGSSTWQTTTRVSEQPEPVLDVFGRPVAAWVLTMETPVGDDEEPRTYTSAIEAGTGAWLVQSWGTWSGRSDCGQPGTSFQTSGRILSFPSAATRHDAGELVGGLSEGESRTFTVERANEFFTATEERTFQATGHTLVTTSAFGEPRDVPALTVDVRTALTYTFPDDSSRAETHTFSERRYYTDGVRLPLKTYTAPDDGDRPELVHELVSYTFGGPSLALTGTLETRQFDGRNPDASFSLIGTTLDDQDLGVEFPQAEALAALARDPRGVLGHLWLQEHPDAVAVRGSYERDPANGTYEWEWWFEDSGGAIVALAKRQVTAGVPVDTARSFAAVPPLGSGERLPGAEGVEVATLAQAYEVARAFDAGVESWRRMEWEGWPLTAEDDSHRHGPRVGVAFLPFVSRYPVSQGLPGPSSAIEAFGPGPRIDLETGGIARDYGATYSCAVDTNWPWDP